MIEIRTLVGELCILGKYQEAMSKSLRDKELFLVFCGKDYAIPFSKSLGAFTKVNRNIKHFSVYHTYQFILGIADLEMKSAKYTLM